MSDVPDPDDDPTQLRDPLLDGEDGDDNPEDWMPPDHVRSFLSIAFINFCVLVDIHIVTSLVVRFYTLLI